MNFKEIKELIEILDQSNLTEINIEDNKGSVVNLKKEKETEIITPQVAQQPAPSIAQPQVAQSAPQVSDNAQAQEEVADNYETINAPMVGTFYKSPSPEESAYVQVGDTVANDTTVCILEAMKLFNKIEAEVSGKIVKILIQKDEIAKVGEPIAILEIASENTSENITSEEPKTEIAATPEVEIVAELEKPLQITSSAPQDFSGEIYLSPLVKSIAQQENISENELKSISSNKLIKPLSVELTTSKV